jgi:GAF domain-containing protein
VHKTRFAGEETQMTEQSDAQWNSERRLLNSVVAVTRHAFGAAASTIFLIEAGTGDLVFEAVSGEGDERLIGMRFPPQTGIAGLVAASGQSMIVDDVQGSPVFSRDAAALTGYLPKSILAAPLYGENRCIGVLEVLDRSAEDARETADIHLLELLADQAGVALEMLLRVRGPYRDERADVAIRLLEAAEAVLSGDSE